MKMLVGRPALCVIRTPLQLPVTLIAVAALQNLGTTVPMRSVVDKIHSLAAMPYNDTRASPAANLLSRQLKSLAQADPSHVSATQSIIAEGLIVVMRSDSDLRMQRELSRRHGMTLMAVVAVCCSLIVVSGICIVILSSRR